MRGIKSWHAAQAEVVQPRQLPDGLLEVVLEGQEAADPFLVEIATYPENRISEQILRGLMLVYLDRQVLPEVITLVLRPKGRVRVRGVEDVRSRLAWSRLRVNWKVVELWNVPAEDLLAADDVGLIPWVPLTRYDEAPEAIVQRCRERIDRQAPAGEQENLLAVTQVLTRLRYNDANLLSILGGRQVMIESPLIQELVAEGRHTDILHFVKGRFGKVPPEMAIQLGTILDHAKLSELAEFAGSCSDLNAFRIRLASVTGSSPLTAGEN